MNNVTALQERYLFWAKISAIVSTFFLPLSTTCLQISLLVMLFFWFLSGGLKEKIQIIWQNSVSKWCVLFFILFLLCTTYSPAGFKEIFESLSKMSKMLCIPFLLPLMQERRWRIYALYVFIVSMMLSLILGVFKFYLDFPFPLVHASSATVFKNHIDTNLMMALAVFILAQIFSESTSAKIRLLCATAVTFMTIYILWYSEGRSGYVVFVGLWALFCIQKLTFRQSLVGVLGLLIVLSCAAFFSEKFQERIKVIPLEVQKYQEGYARTSVGQRLEFLTHTLHLSTIHAIWGFGTGSLKQEYRSYADKMGLQRTTNPHNEYLNILFQLGVVGLFVFLNILWSMYKTSLKLPTLEGRILQGILLSMMVGCLANSWLMDFTAGYLFMILTAVCSGALYEKTNFGHHHHV